MKRQTSRISAGNHFEVDQQYGIMHLTIQSCRFLKGTVRHFLIWCNVIFFFFYSSNMSLSLPIVQYEPTHYLNPFHSDSVRARSNSYSCINGLTVYNCKTTECFFLSFLCCDKSAGFVCPFCTRGQIIYQIRPASACFM